MTLRQSRMAKRLTSGRKAGVLVRVALQSRGSYSSTGEWEPTTLPSLPTLAATEPLTGAERNLLPEASRLSDARRFWLTQTLRPLRVSGTWLAEGDVITYEGINWLVQRVEDWGAYVMADAVRRESDNV